MDAHGSSEETERALRVIQAINFLDSDLFGFSVDIFKVRILISAGLSAIEEFGYDPTFESLCFDFRRVEDLKIDYRKGWIAPPYLEDGELGAIDLDHFQFESIEVRKSGKTIDSQRQNVSGPSRDRYDIAFACRGGAIAFKFADLRVSAFDAEALDRGQAVLSLSSPRA